MPSAIDTIYACKDRKDDLKAGIKSTAVLFASRTRLVIALFGIILVSALYAAGVLNNQGYAYFVVASLSALVGQPWI